MVRMNKNSLGDIIKSARINIGMTQDMLAEKVGVGQRHIMAIENEGKYPSYALLYKLIRELHISADTIFAPEKNLENLRLKRTIQMLYLCDERSLRIVEATVSAVLDSQTEE
jgi:DNA-binding XRE family transcriptional regulator